MNKQKVNYEEQLNALPKDDQAKKEMIDDLKIESALSHDHKVEENQLNQWLERAKQGPQIKERQKKTIHPWIWIAASVAFVFSAGYMSIGRLNKSEELSENVTIVSNYVESYPDSTIKNSSENNDLLLESLEETKVPVLPSSKKPQTVGKPGKRELAMVEFPEEYFLEESVLNTPTAVTGVRGTEVNDKMLLADVSSEALVSRSIPAPNVKMRAKRMSPSSVPTLAITPPRVFEGTNGERYESIEENGFVQVSNDPKSTISIDVDTASYSNIRRFINSGQLPPSDAVRLEEMINYFIYPYPQPKGDTPFSVSSDIEPCPWNNQNKLLHIGIQGKSVLERPKANLVFLLDVSGSMNAPDKLPLLKRAFKLMLNNLQLDDKVGIVAYAGQTGVVLNSTTIKERSKIDVAIDRLISGGSTNGQGGIQLAYQLAKDHFIKNGINRVILATDGDFNVGLSGVDQLEAFIAEKRATGIELSVLGFGRGNIRDDIMERLANHGNGNYAYIDGISEARKALVSQLNSTLVTIAKDVKLQLEFDPDVVKSFRQIGYENRTLAHQDFDNDKKDAGEIGAGHSVTALYEVEFHENSSRTMRPGTLALRYKKPGTDVSKRLDFQLNQAGDEQQMAWASVIAAFGQKLRNSTYVEKLSYSDILNLAHQAKGEDLYGYRTEAIKMIQQVSDLISTGSGNTNKYPEWKFRK